MVRPALSRRQILFALSTLPLLPATKAFAREDYIDLDWSDLVPEGVTLPPRLPQEFVDHSKEAMTRQQPASGGVRTDYNGMIVRLPGYIVPIDFSGSGVTAFILVPFVGACVHVPAPPANQLVFVTSPTPYQSSGLFEAVNVIGMFGTASTSTQLAEIGYALSADHIEPFRY